MKLLIGLMLIFSIGLVSSLEFPVNSTIDLKVPCKFNGTNCNSSAVCNASVIYPNGSVMIDNQLLTNTGNGIPNLTLSDSSVLGEYTVNPVCTQAGISGGDVFSFTISPVGRELTTPQSILYFLVLSGAIIIFLFTVYGATVIPWKNPRNPNGMIIGINQLKYVKLFLGVMSYMLLLFIFGIMRSVSANFLHLAGPERFFNFGYWLMLNLLWPLMVGFVIISFLTIASDKKLHKELLRGLSIR